MAENFSIEHSRTKITEVKKTIEDKKQKLDELKQQKKSLMDAGLALDSSNLDSAVQATLMESINDSLRDVENKAYDVSKDANQNLQSLEQIRQNVDDEITDSQKAKKKLDQTKKLLDTLGVGKSLEKGVNKLDDHLQEATGLKGEVISAMQDLVTDNEVAHTVINDDFHIHLWRSGWSFCVQLCRKDSVCRNQPHYAVYYGTLRPWFHGRNRWQCHCCQNTGRAKRRESHRILFSSGICHCHWRPYFIAARYHLYPGYRTHARCTR